MKKRNRRPSTKPKDPLDEELALALRRPELHKDRIEELQARKKQLVRRGNDQVDAKNALKRIAEALDKERERIRRLSGRAWLEEGGYEARTQQAGSPGLGKKRK